MASGAVTVSVTGLKELQKELELLNADIQKKIGRAATNAAAQVIKKLAQSKAPVAPEDYFVDGQPVPAGNVRDKLSVKYLGKRSRFASEHIVFVKGKRKDGYANRIGILHEFGTVKMPAHPFLRPAFEEGKQAAIDKMADRLRARIKRANKPVKAKK